MIFFVMQHQRKEPRPYFDPLGFLIASPSTIMARTLAIPPALATQYIT